MGDLLGVVSFGLADLPYRFIYFDLNGWGPTLMLLVVKFSYKVLLIQVYGYWVTIRFRKFLSKLSLKARKAHRRQPDKQYFPVPGASKVFEEPEYLEQMAMKYFLQELLDCFDLVAVLVVLAVTRAADTGFGGNMDSEVFWRVVQQIGVEMALEILFMSLTRVIIKRKLPGFQPMEVIPIQRGLPFVAEHKLQLLALVGTTFPAIFSLVTVFKPDIAAIILDQVN